MSLGSTGWHNRPVSFNQGVAGSRPARPTKCSKVVRKLLKVAREGWNLFPIIFRHYLILQLIL